MMAAINSVFDFIFSLVNLMPLRIGLIVSAAIFGVLLVPVYGKVSPQATIAKAKRRIFAALYESVIFRRNTKLSLAAQGKMFINGAVYFLVAIPPILILAIPCILVLAQFNLLYGVRGIVPGQPVIVSAVVDSSVDVKKVSLVSPANVDITPPVRDPSGKEVTWRLTVPEGEVSERSIPLSLRSGADAFDWSLAVGETEGKVYPSNSKALLTQLVYPAGYRLPSWLGDLEIGYPVRVLKYGGMTIDWFVLFLVVSIASGYLASKIFGVEV